MIKIGITGGIGSGKSVVSKIFELCGVPVYISDIESKQLTETSPTIRKALTEEFGAEIYSDGKLDRKLLASIIFTDRNKLQKVNSIIHPEVQAHFEQWCAKQSSHVCAIESAILFESGFDKLVDTSVMVYAPIETRIDRAVKRDNSNADDIRKRISSQSDDKLKSKKCDHVITNDNVCSIIQQVQNILSKLNLKQMSSKS